MQLDLFGFPLEEKPAKKQEKKAAVEKTPVKQEEAPEQAKATEPVQEEYTEVNIHVIPGLRQISILDAEAVARPSAEAKAAPAGQPVAETAASEPVTAEEQQAATGIPATITEEGAVIEDNLFIAETQPAEELPVAVLEAMAKEMAILEEALDEQPQTAGTEQPVEEPPVSEMEVAAEDVAITEETVAEKEIIAETEQPIKEIATIVEETVILEEPFVGEEPVIETGEPMEEPGAILAEAAIPQETLAKQEEVTEPIPPVKETAIEETATVDEPSQPIAETITEKSAGINIIVPASIQFEPADDYEEEPMLMLPATGDDDVIEVNQTLFSRQNVDEMISPAKKAALQAKGKRGRKSFKDIDAEIALVEVPGDEELFQKLYYPISQVAQWFNVNTSLLRFWENEFDILKPRKNRKGDRLFRPEDVKNLQVIYHLLRQRKFSIEGAKKYIKQNKSRAEINIQLIQSLTKFRSFLLEMKANLGA